MTAAGPMKTGLESLCSHLANRGLLVVAYVLRPTSVVLLLSGGGEIELALGRLGGRTDVLAEQVAAELEPYRLRVVGTYELPVEIGERTWYWWRYLRWDRVRLDMLEKGTRDRSVRRR